MAANSSKGGRTPDSFISEHFSKDGSINPKTKRWKMKCRYCPETADPIEHRDSRCLKHISNPKTCPTVPAVFRKEAHLLMMQKGGIHAIEIDDSDNEQDDDVNADGQIPAGKKAKGTAGQAVERKRPLDAFTDRAMTADELNKANVRLLRFLVHGNIPFSASENHFFLKWLEFIRPTYKPPTRYVLTERYLPAEESRVVSEDIKRLEGRKYMTYLIDGWEDVTRRSVYGSLLAEVDEYPVVLGLSELTGMRATADNIVELSNKALRLKQVHPGSIIAVCTDNPTTMQAFRRRWTAKGAHSHMVPLACFMHGINTTLGKISSYPSIKSMITKNSRIVSFFNSSHYWGGQLDVVAKEKGVTRKLKTNTESRFYALILQGLSVRDHRTALVEICTRDGARHSIGGLTPVAKSVVTAVFDLDRWQLTDQLIRVCKPLVDVIGNVEARDANLADCMLELIFAHREIGRLPLMPGDDPEFLSHARRVLNTQFHAMNTDVHWLALFYIPLCRKLAVSSALHSRKLDNACSIALDLAQRWGWSMDQATQLVTDIKDYYHGRGPFQGGHRNAAEWWGSLSVSVSKRPLKAFAIKIFKIVPHAAEVERFFSNLGGVQTMKRSKLTVPHLETLGMLRNHYIRLLHEEAVRMGKATRRKHAHMHTQDEPGINVERVQELVDNFMLTSIPLVTGYEGAELDGPESITLEDIDAEFEKLSEQAFSSEDGDRLPSDVGLDEVFDLSDLDNVRKGVVTLTAEEELDIAKEKDGSSREWDPAVLLRSVGMD
ncbi:hypothetical protein Hypma_003642 [Hypsizygus marmoreus]|uniref:Uncharacterized protein n=1 Tax=Hypsizygus marmoreus TaxID=39966 RepID=A0A369J1C4_HYPMA|nr:hypothetical protein Hypma_003642 [Hypsizygus marmoreus]